MIHYSSQGAQITSIIKLQRLETLVKHEANTTHYHIRPDHVQRNSNHNIYVTSPHLPLITKCDLQQSNIVICT